MPTVSGVVTEEGVGVIGRVVRVYNRSTGALLVETASTDGVIPPPADQHYESVTSQLRFEGANNSTVFTDDKALSWSAVGAPVISTTQSKLGTASLSLNGSSYLTTPADAAFDMGSEDFTAEMWLYPTSNPLTQGVNYNSGGIYYCLLIGQNQLGTSANGCFTIILVDGKPMGLLFKNQNSNPGTVTASAAIAINTWTHLAYVRQGSATKLFVNGVSQGTGAVTGAIDTSTRVFPIGADSTGNGKFTGYIDNVRITKGVARYSANFTPSLVEFPTDADIPPAVVGLYSAEVAYSGEVQVVCLDDSAGATYNDLIQRTTTV